MIVAIQPDIIRSHGRTQSYSERWHSLLKKEGHVVRIVDVYRSDILEQLKGADAFMWRFSITRSETLVRQRLLPVIEMQLGLYVYPDWNTWWHYDDKIAQAFILSEAGFSAPRTWIFWRKEEAMQFCDEATYPLVMKLSVGASSQNVELLESRKEARKVINTMFSSGLPTLLGQRQRGRTTVRRRLATEIFRLLGKARRRGSIECEMEKNYFLVQEFLPGNSFDTRVVIIGSRGFAFRRFNRQDDWRASGSGVTDDNPSSIDLRFVRLGFALSKNLRMNSVAVDGLYRPDGSPAIVEISYTCPTWTVANCPGHWVLTGEPEDGELSWKDGQVLPQDAILADFLARINGGSAKGGARQTQRLAW